GAVLGDDARLAAIVAGGRGRGVVGVAAVAGPPAISPRLAGSERVRDRRAGAPARAHHGLGIGEDRRVAAGGVVRPVEREGDGAAQGAGAPREGGGVTDRPAHRSGRRRGRGQGRRGLGDDARLGQVVAGGRGRGVVGVPAVAGPTVVGARVAGGEAVDRGV